jgi:hypothetical protein
MAGRLKWLGRLLSAVFLAGCVNDPSPRAGSHATELYEEDRDGKYIQLVKSYIQEQGHNPTQALYEVVHKRASDAEADPDTPEAVVAVNFLDGSVWRIAIGADGTLTRMTKRQ